VGVGENVFMYAFLRGSIVYSLDPLRRSGCCIWGPFFSPHFGFCYLAPCLTACRNGGRVDDDGRAWLMMITYKGVLSFIPHSGDLFPFATFRRSGRGGVWSGGPLFWCPIFFPYIRGPLEGDSVFLGGVWMVGPSRPGPFSLIPCDHPQK
jgi:hypothetical protein